MPKTADPAVRMALIDHAARITAEEGRDALTLRRLTTAVGVSTMAVYTHFGGMDHLRREVRREGFARLAAHLDAVDRSGDAAADLVALGWAYYVNGTTNPNLYRAMFMDGPCDEADATVGLDTFERLVDGVRRCVETGRFTSADPVELATQLWVAAHGVVSLELAGMLPPDQAMVSLRTISRNLLHAFGDSPAATGRSLPTTEGD
ncbi:MAG: TetR/AcrR family transcriptional regulator [Acidimicrobiales bacterium]